MSSDSIDSLAFHIALIGLSLLMGGGLWTSMAVPLVYAVGWRPILAVSLAALIFWTGFGIVLARRGRR